MSRRKSVYVSRRLSLEGDGPPAASPTLPVVTTEVRLFYPPGTDPRALLAELQGAFAEALGQLLSADAL